MTLLGLTPIPGRDVGVIVRVAVEVTVGVNVGVVVAVFVGTGVIVGVGVKAGPKICPAPQPEIAKAKRKSTIDIFFISLSHYRQLREMANPASSHHPFTYRWL
jgi:hypothetical protein